jgi:hypothetical protein
MRDRLTSGLLLARAAIESGEDAAANVTVAVGLAAPERLTRVFLEPGMVRRGPPASAPYLGVAGSPPTELDWRHGASQDTGQEQDNFCQSADGRRTADSEGN